MELPAAGGFAVNDQPLTRDDIVAMFHAIHAYPPEARAVFFDHVDSSRLVDVAWIDSVGRAIGVGVYSAKATWPNSGPPPGFRVIPPDSSL